jgi:hypothetical protein
LLDVPKESFTPGGPDADESYMALTFGTLLSSQGADAHRQGPFGPIGGNPRYFTWSVPHGQTPAPAQTPAWSGRSKKIFGPRAWGNIRPAPLAGLASRLPGSCGSVPRTRRTLAGPLRGMQIPRPTRCTPRICWPVARQAPAVQGHRAGAEFCDLAHDGGPPIAADGSQTSRTALRLPTASTRPASSSRGRS